MGYLKACKIFIADFLLLVDWQRDVTVLCVMDNGGFRGQHQIFSHLFLSFEEITAATSLLLDMRINSVLLRFLTNCKP